MTDPNPSPCWCCSRCTAVGGYKEGAELPIFDAHVHYSHDAWENLPPKDAIAILRRAGSCARSSRAPATKARIVSSRRRPISCCLRFARIARGGTLPRGWATRRSSRSWRIASPASATSPSASFTCTAPMPICRCRDAWSPSPGSTARAARPLRCRRHRAPVQAGSIRQDPLGALGFRQPRIHPCDAAQASQPVVRPRLPQRARRRRQGPDRMARAVHRLPGSLHGRNRHIHAGTLALHRRARGLVPRVARRPSAAARRTHRLAQRRCAVRRALFAGIHPRAPANERPSRGGLAATMGAAVRAARFAPPLPRACARARRGDARSKSNYTVAFKTVPDPIRRARTSRSISPCARRAAAPSHAPVRVDANMPEHRHGMNYRPVVTARPEDCIAPKA